MKNNFIKKHEKLILIVLVTAVSFFTLFAAEIILRFTEHKHLIREKYGFPPNLFVKDHEMGTDLVKEFCCGQHSFADYEYPVFTNANGCFDDAFNKTAFREKGYILLVGDSFAWGYAPHERHWGSIMEKFTGKYVAQCGVTGHGTKQELIKAKRIISAIGQPPELIVLGYTPMNDFNDDYLLSWATIMDGHRVGQIKEVDIVSGNITRFSEKEMIMRYEEYKKWKDRKKTLLESLKERSIVLSLIAKALKRSENKPENTQSKNEYDIFRTGRFRGHYGYNMFKLYDYRREYPWIEKAFSEHLANIKKFQELSEEINSNLVIVIINKEDGEEAFKKLLQTINYEKIDYISLEDAYGDYLEEVEFSKLFWKHDGHWNIDGNYFVGLIMSKFIVENSFANISNKSEKLQTINESLRDFDL